MKNKEENKEKEQKQLIIKQQINISLLKIQHFMQYMKKLLK